MSDVSRSCTRCNGVAITARGDAAYCAECNEVMTWSEVIAVVQAVEEPLALAAVAAGPKPGAPNPGSTSPDGTTTPPTVTKRRVRVQSAGTVDLGIREAVAPTLTVPTTDSEDPDPFSQRLG